MTESETLEELLNFFKALAESNRLKIIGLLAQQPHTVEAIADALGIGVSTTSHHLARLAKAGLVSAKADGHYYVYSLHTEILEDMAQRLLHKETLPALGESSQNDVFERKVLNTFLDEQGRIKTFPSQEKKFIVLLRHCLNDFEIQKHYSENEVNDILSRFNDDVATLRRGMIEFHLMARQNGGSDYWVL
ncbi:MAG: metalloregulator ArsR/SmtB family transcription factor [Anaerolineae bacterium]|nr:metalloregulator ArsR/SmtB family transcription factor [Anaerolineae bacterium]